MNKLFKLSLNSIYDFHYTEPCTEFVHTIRSCVQNAEINNNNHVSQISELEIHKACRHLKRGKGPDLTE